MFERGSCREGMKNLPSDTRKSGAWSCFWVTHEGAGAQVPKPFPTALSDHLQGAGLEMEQLRLKQSPILDTSTAGGGLTHHIIILVPFITLFKNVFI